MTTANQNHEKFQSLLRELFQFDCADLDFGIYRIMNHKREVIEKFISEDLITAVSQELDQGVLHDQELAVSELQETAQLIRETLGDKALDAAGNLQESFHNLPIGERYLKWKKRAIGARSREPLEADIFNHLFAFFSRYYQDGDFISKRRYSKQQRYAIPYNGEEVYLHWANSDQYYIKTAEHFHDYSFTTTYGATVHFKLQDAKVEQNNIKGDRRFFLPRVDEITTNEKTGELVIPFEYRPLNEQEDTRYGRSNQQDAILAEFVSAIPAQSGQSNEILLALTAERHRNADNEPVTFLEHHLRQYTRRNTSDFFIHKNLKAFLSRELDFYIKSEVLNLDDMEIAGEDFAEGWFQVVRVIRTMGSHIIDFLDQIEGFQKMLWEKRKFITETQYCITIGNIDERFYPAIAACEPQWAEWKDLFHIDENKTDLFNANGIERIVFMKDHPTLVLDTAHFEQAFRDELLASIEGIDEQCDGLLVHSENFQALGFLRERYLKQIKCMHIDPPYNTETSGFLYKNEYRHSSWMTLMESRILASINMLSADASYLCHIDENEYERLQLLFDRLPIPTAGTAVWDKRNPMNAGRGIAIQHEYVIWRSTKDTPIYLRNDRNGSIASMLKVADGILKKYGGVSDEARKEYATYVASAEQLTGGEKAYRYLDDNGQIYQSVSLRAPEPRADPKFHIPLKHPATGKPCPVPPNGFSRTPEVLQAMLDRSEIIFGQDESIQPRQKVILTKQKRRQASSVMQEARKGKADLDRLGFNFPYCHPVSFYEGLIAAAADNDRDIVMDYFAGSGTTGHAVMNINREDGGNRKFILVEMGQYFDTVLLPRIKKVMFTPEWKDGEPKRMVTQEEAERTPRIIKYLRLESYEDALDNIGFDDSATQQAIQFEDYLLKYMLAWETRESATLLNVEKLARPFDYKLHIHTNGETREKIVDIPETFNYLLGLHVQTRRIYADEGRRYLVYRGLIDQRQVVILWRETEGWQKEELERDQQFVAKQKLTENADEVFVNGDSFIPNAKSLDPVFKARMFAVMSA